MMEPAFAQQLLDAIERMQAFPASVQHIIKLTRDPGAAPRGLVEVIQHDPVVTVKVLRVVNSAYYGLARPITSVEHAVVILGFNTIKNLALGIAVLGLAQSQAEATFDGRAYLRHCLGTAAIARQLAARVPGADANDFFIGGLLHDFGKAVLAQVLPGQFRKAVEYGLWHEVPLHDALLEVTGIDQAEVGAMLLEHWRFPPETAQGIRLQYADDASAPPMAACIRAASRICTRAGVDIESADTEGPLSSHLEQVLGGTLEAIMDSLGDVPALLRAATQTPAL